MTKEITVLTGKGNAGDKGVELHSVHWQPVLIEEKNTPFELKSHAQN